MSLISISSAQGGHNVTSTQGLGNGRHDEIVALRRALQSGDAEAAKTAFAKLQESLPAKVGAKEDSALSQMGKALESGDIEGAKAVLHAAVQEARVNGRPNTQHHPEGGTAGMPRPTNDWPTPPTNDWPVPPSPGDVNGSNVGSLLNVSA